MVDLRKKYPEMFRDCFDLSIPNYWIEYVDKLCGLISAHRHRLNKPAMKVLQVKEKFAGLRFYVDYTDEQERDYIRLAEKFCAQLCDICEEKAETSIAVRRGWMINVCSICKSKLD